MILITGASGSVGKTVLAEVARSGRKHRAMYRSKEEAMQAPAGTDTVIADFADKASLAVALRGVESVYLVCSPIPNLVQLESNAIEVHVSNLRKKLGAKLIRTVRNIGYRFDP